MLSLGERAIWLGVAYNPNLVTFTEHFTKSLMIGNEISAQSFGTGLKEFFGNSFYLRGGVVATRFQYNGDLNFIFRTPGPQFSGQMLSAKVSVGNQWQWQRFNLGCDWIGLSNVLASSTSSLDEMGLTPMQIEDRDGARDDLLKSVKILALNLYLGFSF
jgi:hypothetical protein